jgi:hypothetical protein
VFQDPETTRRLVRTASAHVRAFDWYETAARHLALYREVLAA